ncbi:UNVERIFIED_CONTAM: hypothetical protein Sradi_4906500, partial [Sesamum radiatum]
MANSSSSRSYRELENPQPVESTGFPLISSTLTGDNYLVCSRAIRFALGSRKKLSFIDCRSIRSADDSDELEEWIQIDYMVITWILNTMSKDIVDAFIYAISSRSLWLELEAGQIVVREDSRQLMKFLMGLNSTYEHVQPPIAGNVAIYQMNHKDKKHKISVDKQTMMCDYCKKTGHLKESYFKLHGTFDWYKELTDKKRRGAGRGRSFVANLEARPQLQGYEISNIVRTEIRRLMVEDVSSQLQQKTPFGDVIIAQLENIDESA